MPSANGWREMIHDTLALGFTSIVMLSQAAAAGIEKDPGLATQQLGTIEGVAWENLAGARALVAAYAPVGPENATLPDAVRRLTERFAAETCLDLDLDMSRGETMLAPPVAARLVSRMQAPAVEALTPGEVEVLAALARGLSNGEIGRELHVGEATVKTHLLRAFAKLGVDERTRAVTVAMERGILPSPRQT
jgi:ATP/maltotriose-dependent transcriptional regulator MalT